MSEQRVRLRLNYKPHSPMQKLVMDAFFIPGLLEMWIACGTKWGKTAGLSTAQARFAPLTQQAMHRWIAPVYSQAKIGYRYQRRMYPRDKEFVVCNESGPSIQFPHQDTMIQFFHGQNPESIEGEATASNILDEAAKMKEAVYESTKSTTTVTAGPIIGASTPIGKNWFYKKCMEAKEEMIRARHEKRRPTKIFIHAPSWTNPDVKKAVVIDAKRVLPQRIFDQLYGAEFLDDGSIFLKVWEAFGRPAPNEFMDDQVWYKESHSSKRIYVGADWAKTNDSTVFYGLNERGEEIGHKRFNKQPYTTMPAQLRSFCETLIKRSTYSESDIECSVLHDRTGVGETIHDLIDASEFPYQYAGIVWANHNKELAVSDLMLSFEEEALHLFPWETASKEIATFEVFVTDKGNATYGAAEGEHDDTVMSLVLANMLYREGRSIVTSVGLVDNINNLVTRLYYEGDSFFED